MTTAEDKARKAEARAAQKIIDVAIGMAPCKHLTIWAECRKADPDVHPAEVWRTIINHPGFTYDRETTVFNLTTSSKKESNA